MNTIEKIEIWLKEMNIKDYIIDDNNLTRRCIWSCRYKS